jgi:hypothetical protein
MTALRSPALGRGGPALEVRSRIGLARRGEVGYRTEILNHGPDVHLLLHGSLHNNLHLDSWPHRVVRLDREWPKICDREARKAGSTRKKQAQAVPHPWARHGGLNEPKELNGTRVNRIETTYSVERGGRRGGIAGGIPLARRPGAAAPRLWGSTATGCYTPETPPPLRDRSHNSNESAAHTLVSSAAGSLRRVWQAARSRTGSTYPRRADSESRVSSSM